MIDEDKLYDIQKRTQDRIEKALETSSLTHVSFLYKPQEFMVGNSLNMFKYGEFIFKISQTEIDNMSEEDHIRFDFSKRYIVEEDQKFYKLFKTAADEYHKS